MRWNNWLALVVGCCMAFTAAGDVCARGGGGGGGGRGGGGGGGAARAGGGAAAASRPSPGMGGAAPSRPAPAPRPSNPSMAGGARPAAPAARPATPATRPGAGPGSVAGGARPGAAPGTRPGGAAAGARPSSQDLGNFLNLPAERPTAAATGVGARAGTAEAGARENQAARQEGRTQNQTGRQEGRDQNQQARHDQFNQNQQARTQQRQTRGDEIRNQFNDNHPRWDFWKDNPTWARWHFNRPYRWATWAALGSFVGYGGDSGGGGGYAYDYSDDGVYVDGEQYPIDQQYQEQATALADAGTKPQPDDTQWMPLGVFALTPEDQGKATNYLQLAISKDGIISGTFFNDATQKSQQIAGSLDRKTQRVAMFTEKKTPVLETGVQNLTQDQAPCLLHFADGTSQKWLLVRLPEPKEAQQAAQAQQ